jgi:hypothetical protein
MAREQARRLATPKENSYVWPGSKPPACDYLRKLIAYWLLRIMWG